MDFHHPFYKECLLAFSPKEILATISDYVTENKKAKIDQILSTRLSSIHIAMESPSNIHNALATVRSAEAFSIYNMHVIAPENEDRKRRGRKTTQGAYRWVNVQHHKTRSSYAKTMKEKEMLLVGADVKGELLLEDVPVDKPLCLIFGNEERGLSDEMLSYCDLTYKIPMYGMIESFNVSVSAAISLYELTRKKRALINCYNDLTEEELLLEKTWYYIRACGLDLTRKLLYYSGIKK
ncbi:MAG: tRNA (guanosine(18)-2'-O)-methyltransferase [Chlamydiia bacterium]|nr:tRNA (guanosine(18)-2'-O)-methyltransferase [Chlamydiia bacterium]